MLVIVSATSWLGFSESREGVGKYRELARDTNLAGRVQANMLMVRMGVKDFVISDSTDAIERFNERKQLLETLLERADVEIQNPDRAAKVDAIRADLDNYVSAFNDIVASRQTKLDLLEKLDERGPKVRKMLSTILDKDFTSANGKVIGLAGKAQESLLLGRLYAGKYRLRAEPVDAQNALNHLDDAINHLTELEMAASGADAVAANDVRAVVADYRADFSQASEIIAEQTTLVLETLDVIGPKIAGLAEDIKLSVKADQDELGPAMMARLDQRSQFMVVEALVGIFLGLAAAYLIGRSVVGPLDRLTSAMSNLAGGNLNVQIDGVDRKDEIGLAMRALAVFRDNAIERRDLEDKERARVEKIETAIGSFEQSSDVAIEGLDGSYTTLSDVCRQAGTLTTSSAQAVQGVAAASEELSASIREISSNATESRDVASQARAQVADTAVQVDDCVAQINQISSVVELITDIAEQTNLLALNATIESARAGEAGKGFAVVATEVKALAARTGQATDEIDAKIKSILSASENAAAAMKQIGEVMGRIDEIAMAIAGAVEEQNITTAEIAKSAQAASQQVEELRIKVEDSSDDGTGSSISAAGGQVGQMATELRGNIRGFLDEIRAA